MTARITLIGGPTALVEFGGFRLLTDRTFDEPGDYQLPQVTLTKTSGPAHRCGRCWAGRCRAAQCHDQHDEILDNTGTGVLWRKALRVFDHRGGSKAPRRKCQRIDALAKRGFEQGRQIGSGHGRARSPWSRRNIEPLAGDVIGFVLTSDDPAVAPIYITGDMVWYDGVAEVARRFKIGIVLLFAGSAQSRGPFHLTMDTNDAIETAAAFPNEAIVPANQERWAHFRQSGDDLQKAFRALGFEKRLHMLTPGVPSPVSPAR